MVARLIRAALTHRAVVFLLAGALLVAGLASVRTAPLGVFPEFAPPTVEIQAESPGMAAEDVEALVTTPIELALAGTASLDALRSSSVPGLAVITAVFPYGTDPYRARQMVIERLALVTEHLPHGVRPQVAPLASGLSTILAIGLRAGSTTSPMKLRDLAQWTVRPRVLAVPGVADVVIFGGQVRQLRVTTSPERLWSEGVTFDDLISATTGADAAAGSGFVDRAGQRLLGWLDGRVRDAGDIARATLTIRDGVPLPIASVADVADVAAVAVGDAAINGEPGVVLLVTVQPGVNVLEVTRNVERVISALAPELPRDLRLDPALFRQASFVEHAMANLRQALLVAALLVTAVLVVFLGNLRAVVVSVVSIPLSLLAAVLVLRAFGMTLDVMVLAGLAIAIGAVVDDAIVDVENVSRRLRGAPATASVDELVLDASVEVRSAVVSATFVVALVLLPVVLLGGLEGALFRPLALAYMLATLASLGVALTVTPALARTLLPGAVAGHPGPPRLVAALRPRYERVLDRLLRRRGPVLAAMVVTGLVGAALLPFLRLEFLPEFHETNLVMHMTGAPGTGLDESTRVGRALGPALLAIPGVRSVAQVTGRSNLSEDAWGAERSELLVQLDDEGDHAAITQSLRDRTRTVAGFNFDVKQYLNERIEELLEGSGGAVVVRVRGADLTALEQATRTLTERLATVPGAVDVHAESLLRAPGVRVRPRRDALLDAGLSATAIEQALQAGFGGLPVGHVVRDGQQADLTLALADDVARDPQRLLRLPLVSRSGQVVPLGAVAEVVAQDVRGEITHEDGIRTLRLRLDISGRALADVAADVERTVAATVLPPGTSADVGGEYTAARAVHRRLLGLAGLALIGIVALLLVDFRSPRLVGLALVNVPLALVGGLAAVVFAESGSLSLGAIVGFVTVFGLTMRNGIVLIAHFERLRAQRDGPLERAQIVTGAGDRIAPILMTALATGIALVPLLLIGGRAGGEIEHPLAMVVVAGLLTSTLLNLFVVPALYAWTSPGALQEWARPTDEAVAFTGVMASGTAPLFWHLKAYPRMRRAAAVLLLLALVIVPLAPRIGSWPLIEPDEGRNAENGREMLVEGSWAVPLFNGLPFLDKPPLLFWAIAGSFGMFGVGELAARLPSVLAMLATIGLTAALARALLGTGRTFLAAAIFASCPMVLVFGGLVIFDMPLTALVTAALYCLVRARQDAESWRWTFLAGLAMGLAVLTKGPVGVAIPVVAWVAARGALPAERRRTWWAPALVAGLAVILVVGPWLAAVMRQEPNFLHYALFDETLQRVTSSSRFRRGGPIYYYAGALAWGLGIWMLALAALTPTLVRLWRAGGPDARAIAFCVRATLALVVFFSLSASKRPQYILPALIPLSVLLAAGIAANPLRVVALVRMAAWAAAIAGLAILAGLHLHGELATWKDLPIQSIVVAVAVTLVLWGVGTAVVGRRSAAAVCCAVLFAPCLALALARPLAAYAERRSSRTLAAAIPCGAPVIAFDTFRTALPFYLRRPVLLLSRSGAALTSNYVISQRARLGGPTLAPPRLIRSLLNEAPGTYVLASRNNVPKLRRMADQTHLVRIDSDAHSVLFRSHGRISARADPPSR